MSETCINCDGRGIVPRWFNGNDKPPINGVCPQCGGRGKTGLPLRGWLAGPHNWPDVSVPSGGNRLGLVMLHDGRHALLPGSKLWRVVLVLTNVNVRGKHAGSGPRFGINSKGEKLTGTAMQTGTMVNGRPLADDAAVLATILDALGDSFTGCIQITSRFPRMSYRGSWRVVQDGSNLSFLGDGYMLDKVN